MRSSAFQREPPPPTAAGAAVDGAPRAHPPGEPATSAAPSAAPSAAASDSATAALAREPGGSGTDGSPRSYIRGSGLLLGGRGVSIVLNLAVQVLTVRYLAKNEYGALAYGLGVASIGSSAVLLGLGKTVPRFIPIYQERGDHARVFGTMALAAGTLWGLGLSLIALLFGLRGVLAESVLSDPLTLSLLLVLIALAPVNAFDHLLQNLVAIFATPAAIFWRRHVVGPGLKLAIVLAVMAVSGSVQLLAWGFLLGGILGVGLYLVILLRAWRREGLLQHLRLRRLTLPARELFGFSLPLISAELPVLLRGSAALLLLEFFHSTGAVAEYRSVYPVAGLNLVAFQAFGFLFVPMAARMYARADREGVNELYWRTSAWIMVLTFPVFAVTTSLATPVAVLLFGAAYASAGPVLAVLAVGDFFNAALGFNADTLRVYGKVRLAVVSNLVAGVAFVALAALLIPRYAALGAAVSASASAVIHNLCNHAGLWLGGTGIRLPDGRFVRVALAAFPLMTGLLVVQRAFRAPLPVGLLLAALASLALLRLTRRLIRPEESFPELLRVPLLRRLLT